MRTVRELTEYLALFNPDDLICVWCPGQNDLDNHEGIVILPAPSKKDKSASMDIKYFDNKLEELWQQRI